MMSVATAKLCRMMGEAKGQEVLAQTLKGCGLSSIETADELRKFADALAAREQGMLRMIGLSLRTEAILRGARLER
jgi:hypothetical protein